MNTGWEFSLTYYGNPLLIAAIFEIESCIYSVNFSPWKNRRRSALFYFEVFRYQMHQSYLLTLMFSERLCLILCHTMCSKVFGNDYSHFTCRDVSKDGDNQKMQWHFFIYWRWGFVRCIVFSGRALRNNAVNRRFRVARFWAVHSVGRSLSGIKVLSNS